MEISEFRRAQISADARKHGVNSLAAQNVPIEGQLMVSGVGEALYSVVFPVRYKGKPVLTYGAELADGQQLYDSRYPTISVVLASWDQTINQEAYQRYYTGCSLAIVTGGHDGQKLIVSYRLSGIAFLNPLGD